MIPECNDLIINHGNIYNLARQSNCDVDDFKSFLKANSPIYNNMIEKEKILVNLLLKHPSDINQECFTKFKTDYEKDIHFYCFYLSKSRNESDTIRQFNKNVQSFNQFNKFTQKYCDSLDKIIHIVNNENSWCSIM